MKTRISNGLSHFMRLFISVLCFAFVAIAATAQTKTVNGKVLDELGDPVIGASVNVKGTNKGVVTNVDGDFTLQGVPANAILTISYVGYQTMEESVANKSNITVVLKPNTNALDEVVVVGYGVQRKSDVTGATARVDSEALTAMPVKNALEGMQGKAAGVDITSRQRPGEVAEINIRGVRSIGASNSPLYVVDGMILQSGGIENINPQDIESIDILKDASATAIYGSRGANGVVLVTTKKGQAGTVKVSYSGTVSFDHLSDVHKLMSVPEWIEHSRWAKWNAEGNAGYPSGAEDTMVPTLEGDKMWFGKVDALSWANIEQAWVNGVFHPELVGTYDWTDGATRTGVSTEHTISASGGSDKFNGYVSFGYLNQKGTIKDQAFERYTAKTSFEAKPNEWFTLGGSINASWSVQDYGYKRAAATGSGDYYLSLLGIPAWLMPYDSNGNNLASPGNNWVINMLNPLGQSDYMTNERRTFRANGNFYAQINLGSFWTPLNGLSYRLQFGPEFRYANNGTAYSAEGIDGAGKNQASYSTDQRRAWTLDNLIYYNRTFAEKHRVGITLMQSASSYHNEGSNLGGNVVTYRELWYNINSANDVSGHSTYLSENSMTSYMARLNYTFDDRYMLTASVRRDGSSVLAPGHKWSTFPSFALGWRIDQEKFMERFDFLSQLKIRLGYGQTGNAAISPYSTIGAIDKVNALFGNQNYVTYVPSDPAAKNQNPLANQDLGWERTEQWNVGVDFGLFNNRISGSVDWYKTHTTDLLLPMTIPSLNGYKSTLANVGATRGHGLDIQLNTVNVQTKDFNWSTNISWSLDRCEIETLANGATENVTNNWFVGQQLGVFYDYVYEGIWKTSEAEEAAKYNSKPGRIRVKDLNGDGQIDATNDRDIVGHRRPDWSGGMTNTFHYRDFDFSFFIYSRWGFDIARGNVSLDGQWQQRSVDYFIPGVNEDAKYPAPNTTADPYGSALDVVDASFIKMRNISLGYNLPKNILHKAGIDNLRLYCQLNNPFTIYRKCNWLDTDLYDNTTGGGTVKGYGSETTIRSYVIGINMSF